MVTSISIVYRNHHKIYLLFNGGDMKYTEFIEINPTDYKTAINTETDFYIQFINLNKEAEPLIIKVLRRFLIKYDMLYLRDVVITVLKELITNASKANAKRLYFRSKNLDIKNEHDYMLGMESFKTEVIHSQTDIFDKMEKTNLRVRLIFHHNNGSPIIKVKNNIPIVKEEISKIKSRIEKAYQYNDITQAFGDVLDDSEGAGLGLIMAIMVFKNSSMPKENFKIKSDSNSTTCSIKLTKRENYNDYKYTLTNKLNEEVETLPVLPEIIKEIEILCDTPDVSIKNISNLAKRDPGLTSTILKRVNSAWYGVAKKITSIEEAVKIIGLKGLKAIVKASGVDNIIEQRYYEFKPIWEESYKKAFYAFKTAIQLKNYRLAENAYLTALLSQLGQIVLLSVNKSQTTKILKLAGIKEITDTGMLEEMSLGISQATLGSLIAEKWQFDESLCQSLKFFMRPFSAPIDVKELTYIVYLAHVFTEIEKNKLRFEIIDNDVLEFFKLDTPEEFEKLHNILQQAYESQN